MKPFRSNLAGLLAVAAALFAAAAVAQPRVISKCGVTITRAGSYILGDNLDSVGDCINVRTDFVTIDLDGFTIHGNGTGSAVASHGVPAVVPRGLVVRNGVVTNFSNGLEVSDGVVEGIRAIANTNVGILVASGTVRNSLAEGNTNDGISIGPRSLAVDNVANGNDVGIASGNGSTLIGNTVGANDVGIVTQPGAGIFNNTAQANASYGISAECPSNLLGNSVTANGSNLQLTFPGCSVDHTLAP